jgi:hypothetical protein
MNSISLWKNSTEIKKKMGKIQNERWAMKQEQAVKKKEMIQKMEHEKALGNMMRSELQREQVS